MRAIIETGGKQFAVAPEARIRVPSLKGEAGETITFERVLYVQPDEEDGEVRIGAPEVEGARVTAEILRHGRGDKITVFKYKRRKRYRRKKGHRQNFTELKITGISLESGERARGASEASGQEAAFACPECGKTYETDRGLKQHMALTHKE